MVGRSRNINTKLKIPCHAQNALYRMNFAQLPFGGGEQLKDGISQPPQRGHATQFQPRRC